MRTSGLFTTYSVKIPSTPSKPVQLVFFGDIHRDSQLFAEDYWEGFLERVKHLDNPWFIGMGDYLDSTSTSERACLGSISASMHDTFRTDIQALQMAKVEMLAKELSFMKGRIIGLINGNHYFQFADGTNTDQQLCRLLGCKYLGVSSFVRLRFEMKCGRPSFDIWAHHGAGAGRMLGSSLNRVTQMSEYAEADCYAMGDDHAKMAVPGQPRFQLVKSSFSPDGVAMKTRRPWMVRSGSFLKAYESGKSSYNVDAARGPRNLGHVELHITPKHSGDRSQADELLVNAWS